MQYMHTLDVSACIPVEAEEERRCFERCKMMAVAVQNVTRNRMMAVAVQKVMRCNDVMTQW
jgi:hypothetical protein